MVSNWDLCKYLWSLVTIFGTLFKIWNLLNLHGVFFGDFNCILNSYDKIGGRPFNANPSVRTFRDFVKHCDLNDIGFYGHKYTWCNNRKATARIFDRLDHVFCIFNWLQLYDQSTVYQLPKSSSDHAPIQFLIKNTNYLNAHLFHFQNFWTKYSETKDLVHTFRNHNMDRQHLCNHFHNNLCRIWGTLSH